MAHLYVLRTARPAGSQISKMAIYHLSASIIGRSAGRSVTAAAAYRAAAKIEDQTTGIVHNYDRKQGVDHSEILSPISASLENDWLTNREKLWNKVEAIERRKDAQLAREVTIAIPYELPREEKIALVREYVESIYVVAGMVADVNLHHLEGNNPHAHILLTMRNLETTPDGLIEFGLKNTDWNSKSLLLEQRKSWEEIANKYLANSGIDTRIDCRSLEDQGSPFIPQIHVGVHAIAMKNKGIPTDRSEEFDRIESANNDIREQLEKIYRRENEDIEEENNYEEEEKVEDNEVIEEEHKDTTNINPEIITDDKYREAHISAYKFFIFNENLKQKNENIKKYRSRKKSNIIADEDKFINLSFLELDELRAIPITAKEYSEKMGKLKLNEDENVYRTLERRDQRSLAKLRNQLIKSTMIEIKENSSALSKAKNLEYNLQRLEPLCQEYKDLCNIMNIAGTANSFISLDRELNQAKTLEGLTIAARVISGIMTNSTKELMYVCEKAELKISELVIKKNREEKNKISEVEQNITPKIVLDVEAKIVPEYLTPEELLEKELKEAYELAETNMPEIDEEEFEDYSLDY
jgi:hypothetical protein